MNEKNIVVGLDVGTTKVCTIVGSISETNELEIVGIGQHASIGLKKGAVVNIDKTVKSIKSAVDEARLMAGVEFTEAVIGIAGNHIYSFNSTGVVAIKNQEVTDADVERVIEAAKAVIIPSDREIIHVIPQEFRVDNTQGIKNPVGMRGVRLEAYVHIVTGNIASIQNLIKCVEMAGIKTLDVVLQPIASSEAVITNDEKDLGVVLVDIGGGTTDLAVWKDGTLIHSQIIPVGGNHFTNDLAYALKVPLSEAEKIKVQHGCVLPEKVNQSATITVQGMSGTKARAIQLSVISQVLGARAEELFETINAIVKEKNLEHLISGGFILTGGGALLESISELGEFILMKPVKVGYPLSFGGMTSIVKNPKFSTVLGLLIKASRNNNFESVIIEQKEKEVYSRAIIARLGESMKNVFKEIF